MVQKAKAMQETRCPSEATFPGLFAPGLLPAPQSSPASDQLRECTTFGYGIEGSGFRRRARPVGPGIRAICHKATLSTPVKGQMKIPKFADSFAKLIITRTPAGCLFRTLRFRLGQPARYSGYLRVRHQRYRGPGQSAPNFPVYGILALKSAGR